MWKNRIAHAAVAAGLLLCAAPVGRSAAQGMPPSMAAWEVHDERRPQPPVIDPGTPSTQTQAGQPPSDAVVLFDGSDLSAWEGSEGGPAQWNVEDGYFEVAPGTGALSTKQGFGDVQLHVEWQAPTPATGEGQNRGNSGIFFMDGRYEVQVLDVYENQTYSDGQAAAVYGQYPPMVNASRPPGQWQMYDIIFHRPRFDPRGAVVEPAYVTVFHNGVLVQDHVALTGPTGHHVRPLYEAHEDELPITLQDHSNPVRFRNIWLRELPEASP